MINENNKNDPEETIEYSDGGDNDRNKLAFVKKEIFIKADLLEKSIGSKPKRKIVMIKDKNTPQKEALYDLVNDHYRNYCQNFNNNAKHASISYHIFYNQKRKELEKLSKENREFAENYLIPFSLDPTHKSKIQSFITRNNERLENDSIL
eukprot:TRINITY_DN10864_c0_g1_i1.p1 TRINITY_DN10864_c0_g1~~TRINITY_DN10864_c0_g1_i1.p1  ORF type:complete len:150 (+),score=35.46 TRINITY_DN10864_c0_g1_i1:41-490(+)